MTLSLLILLLLRKATLLVSILHLGLLDLSLDLGNFLSGLSASVNCADLGGCVFKFFFRSSKAFKDAVISSSLSHRSLCWIAAVLGILSDTCLDRGRLLHDPSAGKELVHLGLLLSHFFGGLLLNSDLELVVDKGDDHVIVEGNHV